MVVFFAGACSREDGKRTFLFPCPPNSLPTSSLDSHSSPVSGFTTEPRELTAIIAATVIPVSMTRLAVPTPPLSIPHTAPVPAPKHPMGTGPSCAASQACHPQSYPMGGIKSLPRPRSKRTAAGTIGATWVSSRGYPIPLFDSHRTTPSAAARPYTDPPDKTIAWTLSTRFSGSSKSVSRVPGAAPRTSTPATAPSAQIITVTPLAASLSV